MSAYNDLLNKYNVLVAKCQSLQETIISKEEQWKIMSDEFAVVNDNARKLCTLILAKDKSQINLGTGSGAWGLLQTRDLILQSIESYKKYNSDRSLALQQLLDFAEEKQHLIDGLMDELEYYKNNSGKNANDYEEEKKEKEKEADLSEALDSTDYEVKQKIKDNNINIELIDNESAVSDLIVDAMNELDTFIPTEKSIPIKDSNGKIALAREQKRQKEVVKKFAAEMDIGKIMNDLSSIQKEIITIIGEKGLSENLEIVQDLYNAESNKTKTKDSISAMIYTAEREMQAMGIITSENISIPLQGKTNVKIIRMTELGNRLYSMMHNKKPCIAEANRLLADHDNIHHGYGIKAISQGIQNSELYLRVNMDCRKDPLIVDENKNRNVTYIPDIIAIYKDGGYKCFFEYERGFSSEGTIIEKCNKMCHFTRNMYFLTNNNNNAETLAKHLTKWKKEAAKRKIKAKIYLSTAKTFQANNFDVKKKWQFFWGDNDVEPVTENKNVKVELPDK